MLILFTPSDTAILLNTAMDLWCLRHEQAEHNSYKVQQTLAYNYRSTNPNCTMYYLLLQKQNKQT